MWTDPLPHAWGGPTATAVLRSTPDDFQVDEELGFAPDGEGQHVLLRIRKRNTNTEWLARHLARVAGVPPRSVGFAGLKDRRAVTSQWFSIDLAGGLEPDWSGLNSEQIEVLDVARHRRKLRRGSLSGNRFRLVLRQVEGNTDLLEQRMQCISSQGVPNYFGAQRFGHKGDNLHFAMAMFRGELRSLNRYHRGLYLSAARSFLFNVVLAARVTRGSWLKGLEGEALLLSGSRSFFIAGTLDVELEQRIAMGDLLPSGPLWGRGDSPARAKAALLEREVLSGLEDWRIGLEAAGLKHERRALLVKPGEFSREWLDGNSLALDFFLPAGSYATAVVRELVADKDSRAL